MGRTCHSATSVGLSGFLQEIFCKQDIRTIDSLVWGSLRLTPITTLYSWHENNAKFLSCPFFHALFSPYSTCGSALMI